MPQRPVLNPDTLFDATMDTRIYAFSCRGHGFRYALDCPVALPVAGDFGGAFGAARLAIMAATGAGAEIATLPKIARVIEPDATLKDALDAGHARYRAAQTAIKDLT